MHHFSQDVSFNATENFNNHTAHALLVTAFNKAQNVGLFSKLEQTLHLKMKKRTYSWADKLKTLWASIVVGCNHTSEINSKLGSHERAAARIFNLERFPDQSQVNRLLWAFEAEHVEQWRKIHLDLLCRYSRATARKRWLLLANRERLLPVDIDQRAIVVRGKQFELATKGYFSHKRGRKGYQLSLAFIGGPIGEVLDESLDSGNTPIVQRIDDLLSSAEEFCRRSSIPKDCILIRGDAQLGTPAIMAKIQAKGFHFLLKGLSPARAKRLLKQVGEQVIFFRVENGLERLPAWMCDMGEVEHREGRDRSSAIKVKTRTLLMVRQLEMNRKKRPDQKTREKLKQQGEQREKVTRVDYFLTDLTEKQLPVERVLAVYNDRPTIERYFYDEQYGLGARQVRTSHFAGEAMFEYIVATTNNLLKWMRHTTFRGTEIEKMGVSRIVHEAMQIAGRIYREGRKWVVEMPAEHVLVKQLMKSWKQLRPLAVDT